MDVAQAKRYKAMASAREIQEDVAAHLGPANRGKRSNTLFAQDLDAKFNQYEAMDGAQAKRCKAMASAREAHEDVAAHSGVANREMGTATFAQVFDAKLKQFEAKEGKHDNTISSQHGGVSHRPHANVCIYEDSDPERRRVLFANEAARANMNPCLRATFPCMAPVASYFGAMYPSAMLVTYTGFTPATENSNQLCHGRSSITAPSLQQNCVPQSGGNGEQMVSISDGVSCLGTRGANFAPSARAQYAQSQHAQAQYAQAQYAQAQYAQAQYAQAQYVHYAQSQHAQARHAQVQHAQAQYAKNMATFILNQDDRIACSKLKDIGEKRAPPNMPGMGWTKSTFFSGRWKISSWTSPSRKIKFRRQVDAFAFEGLRKKFGADEAQAWVEYTKLKKAHKMNRNVVNPKQYDTLHGSCVEFKRRTKLP